MLLLVSIPIWALIGIHRESIVYPAPVSLRKLPELVVSQLEITECGGRNAESRCCCLLRHAGSDPLMPELRACTGLAQIEGMHEAAVCFALLASG